MDKIILRGIEKHLKDSTVIGHSHHSFMRENPASQSWLSFMARKPSLADQEKPVYVIFLGFSKTFPTVSHSILLDKMSSTELDKHIMDGWVTHWQIRCNPLGTFWDDAHCGES